MTTEEILNSLNDEQRRACTLTEGNIRLVAGAGSGKTNTLAKRVAYISQEKNVDPSRILCITFTNKASEEMKERISNLLGVSQSELSVGTFHRLAMDIVNEDAMENLNWLNPPMVGEMPMKFAVQDFFRDNPQLIENCTNEEKEFLMDSLIRYCETMTAGKYEANMLDNNKSLPEMVDTNTLIAYEKEKQKKMEMVKQAKSKLSYREKKVKEGKATQQDLEDIEALKEVIQENRHEHKENSPTSTWAAGVIRNKMRYGMLNFNELISVALYLLQEYPEVRDKWVGKYDYIQVDEFQDTDEEQFEFAKILSSNSNNLFVVGDADQSIYGFRGTSSELFINFEEHLGRETTTIQMTRNYRSLPEVLDIANKVIKLDNTRMPKDLVAQKQGDSNLGIIVNGEKPYEVQVREKVQELLDNGVSSSEIAILYRAGSDEVATKVYNELKNAGITMDTAMGVDSTVEKYATMAFNILRYKETGDITYFTSFAGQLSNDAVTTYEELKSDFDRKVDAIDDVLDDIDYLQILDDYTAKKFKKDGNPTGSYKSYLEKQEDIKNAVCTLLTNWGQLDEEEKKQMYRPDAKPDIQTPEEKTGVKMMTMHKSKGLEFDNVFVCGLSERTKNGMENNQSEKNEECRLHYVAYSRAKENLYIVESSLSNYSIFTNEVKDLFEKKGKLEEEDFDDDFEIC